MTEPDEPQSLPPILTAPFADVRGRMCRIVFHNSANKLIRTFETTIVARETEEAEGTGKKLYFLELSPLMPPCFQYVTWDGTQWLLASNFRSNGQAIEFNLV